MRIPRATYLDKLISRMWDGQVKVVTGIRRCGKSYLLNTLFREHLIAQGTQKSRILSFALDRVSDIRFRDPLVLAAEVRRIVEAHDERFYLFVDEIQLSDEVPNPYNERGKPITFYDALNDLMQLPNLDIYVTGSNSKMLASDILTEFRGRADNIRLHPLSFAEYHAAAGGEVQADLDDYAFFGGMPLVLSQPGDEAKMTYLQELFSEVYIKDIVERKHVRRADILGSVIDFLCSSTGSLTNPTRMADAINSKQRLGGASVVAANTVSAYLGHLTDAFLFSEARRFDVKGKAYFDFPSKFYCEDVGLRGARIGFRQQEMGHIMENILYNELVARGWSVDVGVVFTHERNGRGSGIRVPREIDFVGTKGGRRAYVQSAWRLGSDAKTAAELRPLSLTGDSFEKIIVRGDVGHRFYDEQGVLNIGLADFLLDDGLL